MHTLQPAFVPIHRSKVFRETFGQAVERVRPMPHIRSDKLVLRMHSDGMDGTAVNNALEAALVGCFPYVVSADKVRAEKLRGGLAFSTILQPC